MPGTVDASGRHRKVAVSIVTYRTDRSQLEKCLASLDSPVVGIIRVVDNSSQKYIRNIVESFGKTEYIPNSNVGYGAAHNIAMRRSIEESYGYHLVLNADVYFDSGVLETMIEYMESNHDVGQLHPRIFYPDGRDQYTCRMLPTPLDLIARRFLPGWIMAGRRRRYLLKDHDRTMPLDVPYHQGSFMMFRVSVLRECGLFDERFFMYPEDIDITRRIHSKYRTMYYPSVSVCHEHGAGSYHSFRILCIHMVNMVRYFNKWGWFCDSDRRKVNRDLLNRVAKMP